MSTHPSPLHAPPPTVTALGGPGCRALWPNQTGRSTPRCCILGLTSHSHPFHPESFPRPLNSTNSSQPATATPLPQCDTVYTGSTLPGGHSPRFFLHSLGVKEPLQLSTDFTTRVPMPEPFLTTHKHLRTALTAQDPWTFGGRANPLPTHSMHGATPGPGSK